jgi:hypothetical protein
MGKLKKWIQENSLKMDIEEPNAATWDSLKHRLSPTKEEDSLKHHIAENQNKLQIETPNAQSWEEISRYISAKKTRPVRAVKRTLVYLSAACIITIISLGVFRYVNDTQTNPDNEVVKKTSDKTNVPAADTTTIELTRNESIEASLPDKEIKQPGNHKTKAVASKPSKKQKKNSLPPEVLQIEKDYDELIAGQINYTKGLAIYGENAGYFQEFMNDFKDLEKQEKELRKLIAQNGLQDNSIDELTTLYQQKLTILKKLQTEINKTSNRNKNITDTIPTYLSL